MTKLKRPEKPELQPSSKVVMDLLDDHHDETTTHDLGNDTDVDRLPLHAMLKVASDQSIPFSELCIQTMQYYDTVRCLLVRVRTTDKDRDKHRKAMAKYRKALDTYEVKLREEQLVQIAKDLAESDPAKLSELLARRND